MKLKISVLILLLFISFPCFSQVRDTTLLGVYTRFGLIIELNQDGTFYVRVGGNRIEGSLKELFGKFEVIKDSLLVLKSEKEINTETFFENDTSFNLLETKDSVLVGGEEYTEIYHIIRDKYNTHLLYAGNKTKPPLFERKQEAHISFINVLNHNFAIFYQWNLFVSKRKNYLPTKEGLRGLPQYLKEYVLPKPVKTKIINVAEKGDKYVITFNKGNKHGLKVGMMLYFKSKDEHPIQIVSVEERTCAVVIEQDGTFLHTKGAKYTTKPKRSIYLKSGSISTKRRR